MMKQLKILTFFLGLLIPQFGKSAEQANDWRAIAKDLRDLTPKKPSLPIGTNKLPIHPKHKEKSGLRLHSLSLTHPKISSYNQTDNINLSLLMATKAGLSNQVKKFLSSGASLRAMNKRYKTAFHIAIAYNKVECMDALVSHALKNKNEAVLNEKPHPDLLPPLHYAAFHGRLECLNVIFKANISPMLLHKGGKALAYAYKGKKEKVRESSSVFGDEHDECIKLLKIKTEEAK